MVGRLVPPAGLAPWTARAKVTRVVDGVLFLVAEGARSFHVPGSFDPEEFNELALGLRAREETRVFVRFLHSGEVVARLEAASVQPSDDVQSLRIPALGLVGGPFEGIEVELHSADARVAIESLELRDRPLAGFLPGPGEPGFFRIGGVGRRAAGAAPGGELAAEIRVPPGARLAFAFAPHPFLGSNPASGGRLTVSARGPGFRHTHAYSLQAGSAATWSSEGFELGPTGGEYSLSFRAQEGFVLISEPIVFVPRVDPPTVLLVVSDTHRGDHLASSPGSVDIRTPALDELARRGVLFVDAMSPTNVTLPSHVSMMTANHPRDTGIFDNRTSLLPGAATLAERFRDAGYQTAAVVSARHLRDDNSGLGQGFDHLAGPERGTWDAELSVAHLTRFLEQASDRPAFLWLHLFDAHRPYAPPERLERLYYPEGRDPFDPSLAQPAVPEQALGDDLAGLRDLAWPEAQYKGEITYLDDELRALFAHPRVARGVIAFTADHGESFGRHGIFWDHAGLYPDSLHVPLILAGPGVPEGVREEGPARTIDLGRTLLDLVGLDAAAFPGENLLAELEPTGREVFRFAISEGRREASVTSGRWHLIHQLSGRRRGSPEQVELFDLAADPRCERNLAGSEVERACALCRRLSAWLRERSATGLAGEVSRDGEVLAELEQLGYAAGDEPTEVELTCGFCPD